MASNIRRCRNASEEISAAAEIIGGNEDLVVEILLRLPAKSLIRLNSVSKTWLSLISGYRFSILWQQHQRQPKISGLFFTSRYRYDIKYIPPMHIIKSESDCDCNINSTNGGEYNSLALIRDMDTTKIIDSCNGLILICCLFKPDYDSRTYHVYNPTTKQFSTDLHRPFPQTNFDLLYLTFDPLKSLQYKVVWLQKLVHEVDVVEEYWWFQIHIYSSKTNEWKPSGHPFLAPLRVNFRNGVYCNGSIHWITDPLKELGSLYFDVHQERLCPLQFPPFWDPFKFQHFGESRGHLHLVEHSRDIFKFDVFEMERDYSKWLFKYHVDLDTMDDLGSHLKCGGHKFYVLSLTLGENDEEDSFMLLLEFHMNTIIFCNLKDNIFKKLLDVNTRQRCSSWRAHRCIETLFPV
ncbi:F-box protein At5g07610-like [Cornus florida]|uniref:F-box protein At5g07610-like n=1 Tax=Cornus florida TaxID=4283 RepID=UPI00289F9E05|nr:F-box protein At5g07610-like [Cornus florida]